MFVGDAEIDFYYPPFYEEVEDKVGEPPQVFVISKSAQGTINLGWSE